MCLKNGHTKCRDFFLIVYRKPGVDDDWVRLANLKQDKRLDLKDLQLGLKTKEIFNDKLLAKIAYLN